MPVDAICYSDVMCQEQSHKDGMQFFYDEILRALKRACIKSILLRKNKRKFKHCLGWNNTMKEQYTTSRNAYKKWLLVGKPRKGVHFLEMKAAKKKLIYAFRKRKRTLERSKADAMVSALISDSSGKCFWSSIRSIRTNAAKTLPQSVDGINGEQAIANMWEKRYRYSKLFNSVNDSPSDLFNSCVSYEANYRDLNQYSTNFKAISSSIQKLPTNRSTGNDDIHAEHLIHAHRAIAMYLGLLFNACLMHGFIPPPPPIA